MMIMSNHNTVTKTVKPSGVFRQPRQDDVQESISQYTTNQDSLCKVSDFEISIRSKYNLPDLCNVNGKDRAVYWLYKHSLADSDSVRNCKLRTESITDTSLARFTARKCSRASLISSLYNHKTACKSKRANVKKKLCKLCKLFLLSPTSDIEIKETYNSYINLKDLEAVDVLLKNNENLSIDKYDNLMMNLEFRRKMLEKQQKEERKRLQNEANGCEKQSDKYRIEKYINLMKKSADKARKHKCNSEKRKPERIQNFAEGQTTDSDVLTRSGLEISDLDHILNQIKFFLQSDKLYTITEEQKSRLENYLRILSDESDRFQKKRQIYQGALLRKLKDSIRSNLRQIVDVTEKEISSSMLNENDSKSDFVESSNKNSLKCLKESKALPRINLSTSTVITTAAIQDEESVNRSYTSVHSDIDIYTSEKELKCQDLRYSSIIEEAVKDDSTDKLIFKRYHLDYSNDLVDFTSAKKPLNSKHKQKLKEKDLEKFRSIRNFDEADTFKSLEVQKKEKNYSRKAMDLFSKSGENVCIMKPAEISWSGELNKMNEISTIKQSRQCANIPVKISRKHSKQSTKLKRNTANNTSCKEEMVGSIEKQEEKSNYQSPRKASPTQLNKDDINEHQCDKEKVTPEVIQNYVCFKEVNNLSSGSTCEIKESSKKFKKSIKVPSTNLKTKKIKIKSHSFPQSRNDPREVLDSDETVQEKNKSKERRRKVRKTKEDEDYKVSQSENCIEKGDVKKKHKTEKEENNLSKTEPLMEAKDVMEHIEGDDNKRSKANEEKIDENNYKVFLKINSVDEDRLKITSYMKEKKYIEEIATHTEMLDQLEELLQEIIDETPYKTNGRNVLTCCTKASTDSMKAPLLSVGVSPRTSNQVIQINDSLIQVNEQNVCEAIEKRNMEDAVTHDMLSKFHKSLVPNEYQSSIDTRLRLPIVKKGAEVARINRQSPSCAYTVKTYVQKINKSTQMFEHVTRNDLYTLQWIHDNLFEININPHTLIVDEKIKEVSEMSHVSQ